MVRVVWRRAIAGLLLTSGASCVGVEEGAGDAPAIERFTAAPEVVRAGAPATLSYAVRGAATVSIAGVLEATGVLEGEVATPPLPAGTARFTLVASRGAVTSSRTVEVVADDVQFAARAHARFTSVTLSDNTILSGGMSRLAWATSGARSLSLFRLGERDPLYTAPAEKIAGGEFDLRPLATSAYQLEARGEDGHPVLYLVSVRVESSGEPRLEQRFDLRVRPTLAARCTPCHAFATSYALIAADPRLLARPEDSLLYWKGEHSGPDLDAGASQELAIWLLEESASRGIARAEPTVQERIARAGACLDRATWLATYTATAAAHASELAWEDTRAAVGGGPCHRCHDLGIGGVTLAEDEAATFEAMRRWPAILKLIDPLTLGPSWRLRDRSGTPGHPTYTFTATRARALEQLGAKVSARALDPAEICPLP